MKILVEKSDVIWDKAMIILMFMVLGLLVLARGDRGDLFVAILDFIAAITKAISLGYFIKENKE